VDVLTAHEDGMDEAEDSDLLDRAAELKRTLFTQDKDFIREASERQQKGIHFFGVIYAHQLLVSIGGCVRDLVIIAKGGEPEDMENRIEYLPL
jgi:hypothetical protein